PRLGDVVASSWAISSRGGLEPLPAGLRAWLMRALQLDPRESFASAIDAQDDLERVLGDSDYMAAPTTLEAFLAHYRNSVEHAPRAGMEAREPGGPAGFGDAGAGRARTSDNVGAGERTAEPLHHVEDAEPPPLSTPVVAPAAAPAAAPAPQVAKPAAAASV